MKRVLTLTALLLLSCYRNHPPDPPEITGGATTAFPDSTCTFYVRASDPDADNVRLRVAWGDGDTFGWSDFAASGESVSVSHSWDSVGNHAVTAQARDVHNSASAWSDAVQVSVVLPVPCRVIDSIPVPVSPDLLTMTPNGDYLYLTGYDAACVYVLRTSDGVLVDSFSMPYDVGDPVVSPDSRLVYFACWDGYVYAVETASNTVVDSAFAQEGATGASLSPDGSTLYAVGWYDDYISVIRTSDMTLTESIPHGRDNISGVLATGDGKSVYVLCSPVLVASTESKSIIASIDVGAYAGELLPDPELLYLAHERRGVYLIRTSDHTAVDTVFSGAWGLSAHPGGEYLYLTADSPDDESSDVIIVSTADRKVTRLLRALGPAYFVDVACHPDGNRVYVGARDNWVAWLYVLGR
jgi:DNA-binding beta-propeller fold protein YncE